MKKQFKDLIEGETFQKFGKTLVKHRAYGVDETEHCQYLMNSRDMVEVVEKAVEWVDPTPEGVRDEYGLSSFGGLIAPMSEDEEEGLRQYLEWNLPHVTVETH